MVHHVNTSGHLLVATGLGDAALVISSHHHLSNKTIFVTMVIHKLQEVLIGVIFSTLTTDSGMALLDVTMLAAVLRVLTLP